MRTATFRNIQVEILVEYEAGKEKFAAIRAIEGKPFHRRDEWLSKTEYATVKSHELSDIQSNVEIEHRKPNLLELALIYSEKKQWYSGESVWLWRIGNRGVFLKEQDGMFVTMNITKYRNYLIVFWLNPATWSWEVSQDLVTNYYQWIGQYKKDTRKK